MYASSLYPKASFPAGSLREQREGGEEEKIHGEQKDKEILVVKEGVMKRKKKEERWTQGEKEKEKRG